MNLFLFVCLLCFNFLFATEFKIEGKKKDFLNLKNIDYFCPDLSKCQALSIIGQLLSSGKYSDLFGGSHYCLNELMGRTILGVNKFGDGRAFCLLSDNSLIEINSLGAFLGPVKAERKKK
jgi:hypothetical protein